MVIDSLDLLLIEIVVFIYGTAAIVSVLFTFFNDTYHRIDRMLKLEIVPARILTPLERNINWFEEWLFRNNKTVRPVLAVFSVFDMKVFVDLIIKS